MIVAHAIYGVPSTINCANYVYFLAMDSCLKLGNQEAIAIFLGIISFIFLFFIFRLLHFFVILLFLRDNIEELVNLHRGQGFDIYWRDNLKCPSELEYMDMVAASMFIHFFVFLLLFISIHYFIYCFIYSHFLFNFNYLLFLETGGLFRLAVRLMQAFSENKKYTLYYFNSYHLLIFLTGIFYH